ncbi:hypothetical protein [Paenibacillus periandrae]|uniref:hypothetical protein n=1 Tax=Paenibacillus periandrae TaxID=1761741 RepID=UPI001F09D46E|nr:hypothetical protein [Paenibacillus periandrae]
MNNNILEVRKRIIDEREGQHFLKTILIGIPFAKITLNITIRKELSLPLTHEAVLKLLSLNWCHYDELRKLLGVDTDYMDTIILELGMSDYINHFGKQISISRLGRTVLETMKTVKIEPDIMENIYINLLDGSIVKQITGFSEYREKVNCDAYLTKRIETNSSYIIEHEPDIKEIYDLYQKTDQKNFRVNGPDILERDELYRIISIKEYEIVHKTIPAHLFQLVDEADQLDYVMDTGNEKENDVYSALFRLQMKEHPISFVRLFDTKYYKSNEQMILQPNAFLHSEELELMRYNRNQLKVLMTSVNINLEQIHDGYYTNRLLFYQEYQDLFFNLSKTNPGEIILISDHFYDLQRTEYGLLSLLDALSQNAKLYIGFMDKDTGTKKVIQSLRSKNSNNITIAEMTNVRTTTILIDRQYMITVYYKPVHFGKEVILEEIALISFNPSIIESQIDELREVFALPSVKG